MLKNKTATFYFYHPGSFKDMYIYVIFPDLLNKTILATRRISMQRKKIEIFIPTNVKDLIRIKVKTLDFLLRKYLL